MPLIMAPSLDSDMSFMDTSGSRKPLVLLLFRWTAMKRQIWIFLCLHLSMLLHLLHLLLVLDHLLLCLTGIKIFLSALISSPLISSSWDRIIKMTYAPCLRSKTNFFESFLPSKLTWVNSCSLSFLHCHSSCCLDIVVCLVLVFVLASML